MKFPILITLLFSTALSAQQKPAKTEAVIAPAKIKSKEDSVQYALGIYMGNYLIQGGFNSLQLELFLAGLNDVYRGKPRQINDSIAYGMLALYQDEAAKKRSKLMEEKLFEAIKDKPGLGKLPSGVQFIVINPGKGRKPQETDSVVVNYKGNLLTGVTFENTFLGKPIVARPADMIAGLNEVLQMMPIGATYQAFIPAALAYGAKGYGNLIPPNSALMVTVELVDIKR